MVSAKVTSTNPFTAWQVNTNLPDPANPTSPTVLDVFQLMGVLAAQGNYTTDAQCFPAPQMPTGSIYTLTISKPGFPTLTAALTDWVVFDGTFAHVLTNAAYQASYTTLPPPT